MASYSSRGPTLPDHILKPDLIAPGNHIVSLRHPGSELERIAGFTNLVPISYYFPSFPGDANSRQYFVLSGTSMSAAVVAGAAADLIQKNPRLSPDTVKLRLMLSARKVWRTDGRTPNLFSRGAGLLDVDRALHNPVVATRSALSPWLERTDLGIIVHLQTGPAGEPTVWTDPTIWSNQALWADLTSPTPTSPTWADPILPGSGLSGQQALWADLTTDPTAPVAPSGALLGQQALWADLTDPNVTWGGTSLWASSALQDSYTLDMQLMEQQALWADLTAPTPTPPPGSTTTTTGSGATTPPPPPPMPTATPTDQALWADIFRVCITGDK
jgi:serine protease AprX